MCTNLKVKGLLHRNINFFATSRLLPLHLAQPHQDQGVSVRGWSLNLPFELVREKKGNRELALGMRI
jgi:hypothetical protein